MVWRYNWQSIIDELEGLGLWFNSRPVVLITLFPSSRFKGFCVTILLISLIVTFIKKKARNQINLKNEKSPSIASVQPFFNVSIGNDSMMSFKTSVIFGSISMIFLVLWIMYTQVIAEDYSYRSIFYNLTICFYLLFSITPPLYFFKRIAKFKRALSIVHDIFS